MPRDEHVQRHASTGSLVAPVRPNLRLQRRAARNLPSESRLVEKSPAARLAGIRIPVLAWRHRRCPAGTAVGRRIEAPAVSGGIEGGAGMRGLGGTGVVGGSVVAPLTSVATAQVTQRVSVTRSAAEGNGSSISPRSPPTAASCVLELGEHLSPTIRAPARPLPPRPRLGHHRARQRQPRRRPRRQPEPTTPRSRATPLRRVSTAAPPTSSSATSTDKATCSSATA
jgi:hypothetical protein